MHVLSRNKTQVSVSHRPSNTVWCYRENVLVQVLWVHPHKHVCKAVDQFVVLGCDSVVLHHRIVYVWGTLEMF